MKTLIAIPCMDTMDAAFVNCLLRLRPVGDVDFTLLPNTLIYNARNNLAKKAIAGGYDFILWLDSDMTFDEDLLERMVESIGDKQMLTALCYGRRPPFEPCIYKRLELEKTDIGYKPIAESFGEDIPSGIFKVAGCGFACVLQRVEMLDTVMTMFGMPFYPLAGFGEDFSFCYRASMLDYEFFCDSSIRLGHLTEMEVNADTVPFFKKIYGVNANDNDRKGPDGTADQQ